MPFPRQHLTIKQRLRLVFFLFLLVTTIEIINHLSGRSLNQYGLLPRQLHSLGGILLSPLLHGSSAHYFSNIAPLILFSFLMLTHGSRRFLLVTACCLFFSGLLTWTLGRSAIHIGASGLIYGYFGYLVLAGILSLEIKLILLSIAVAVFYGGLIYGLIPSEPYISWEGHLFGFLVGLVCATRWAKAADL